MNLSVLMNSFPVKMCWVVRKWKYSNNYKLMSDDSIVESESCSVETEKLMNNGSAIESESYDVKTKKLISDGSAVESESQNAKTKKFFYMSYETSLNQSSFCGVGNIYKKIKNLDPKNWRNTKISNKVIIVELFHKKHNDVRWLRSFIS